MTRPRRSHESRFAVLAVTIAFLGVAAVIVPSSGAPSPAAPRPARGELIPPLVIDEAHAQVDYAGAVALREAEISRFLAAVAEAERVEAQLERERQAAADRARREAKARADRSRRGGGECSAACVAHLQRIAACESNGYGDRRNPTYRGRYQFDRQTWASVGGSGDPADASPEEQDMRARMLYASRGSQPWPRCGA